MAQTLRRVLKSHSSRISSIEVPADNAQGVMMTRTLCAPDDLFTVPEGPPPEMSFNNGTPSLEVLLSLIKP